MTSFYEPLFQRYKSSFLAAPPRGYWRNYAGLIAKASMFVNASLLSYQILPQSPYPGDGAYGSDTEHGAVLAAIDCALRSNRDHFSMMELGAGWGPWISLAGLICQ
jgi:hypothetical protein